MGPILAGFVVDFFAGLPWWWYLSAASCCLMTGLGIGMAVVVTALLSGRTR